VAGMDFAEILGGVRVIPVVEIPHVADAVPLARALSAAGIPCGEITLRTASAVEAMAAIAEEFPDFLLGAGTVLTTEQADAAVAAGARFLVAPGVDGGVIGWAQERGVPILPGACTPTEIMATRARGIMTVKLFPAEACGGLTYLRAVAAPFPDMQFVPTGGVSAGNLAGYLAEKRVVACGGSWMVRRDLIASGEFGKIEQLAAEAVAIAAAVPAVCI